MKKFIINANDSGQRADKFILKACNIPKGLMYKFIRTKKIKLNRKKFEISYKLQEGDILEFYIEDEFFNDNTAEITFLNSSADINVIYEDENILIVNKPVGIIVHSDKNNNENTLADSIKNYLYQKGEYNPQSEASFAPATCNRIDRNTCGIVIAAKNAMALREINEKIRLREIHKKYLCLTINPPPKNEDTLKAYHFKNETLNKVVISNTERANYKEIVTKYRVIEKYDILTLVEVELITGRSHQIRAHFAYIGCPILGDTKYGVKSANDKFKVYNQALCAYGIKFEFNSDSQLNYLNGKEFKLDISDIWFNDIIK